MRISSLAIPSIFILASLFTNTVYADTATNDHVILNVEGIDAVSQQDNTAAVPTPIPTAIPQQTTWTDNIPSPFTFSLTNSVVDFGILATTTPVTRDSQLTIKHANNDYQVFEYIDHEPKSQSKATIPDTTCDNGSCSQDTSSLWINNLTYGFGFHCASIEEDPCPPDFHEDKTFRAFSNISKGDPMLAIMESDGDQSSEAQAEITYQINISGTQPKENYTNTITYLAVPNF